MSPAFQTKLTPLASILNDSLHDLLAELCPSAGHGRTKGQNVCMRLRLYALLAFSWCNLLVAVCLCYTVNHQSYVGKRASTTNTANTLCTWLQVAQFHLYGRRTVVDSCGQCGDGRAVELLIQGCMQRVQHLSCVHGLTL